MRTLTSKLPILIWNKPIEFEKDSPNSSNHEKIQSTIEVPAVNWVHYGGHRSVNIIGMGMHPSKKAADGIDWHPEQSDETGRELSRQT